MKVYIEALFKDGSQILGNLDGQTVIEAKNYKRTQAYRARRNPNNFKRPTTFRVVDAFGRTLEQWENK